MPDVREAFRAATEHVQPEPGALQRQHRRQRRLVVRRRLSGFAIAAAVAIAAIAIAVAVLGDRGHHGGPAGENHPVTRSIMHNGPIELFGIGTNGVRTSDGRFAFKCRGSCTEINGADWSPDGGQLAVITACGGACGSANDPYHGIRIVDPAADTDQVVLPGEISGPLKWSPDGSRIAYVDHGSIFVMNPDGFGRRAVAVLRGDQIFPTLSWSPDGSRIAYDDGGRIFVVGVDGSARTAIANGSDPAWSPDGASIAYLANCDIRTISPDGSSDRSLVDLTSVQPVAEACGGPIDLTWSPDGKQLGAMVFRGPRDPNAPSRLGVFVVNANGTGARLVTLWNRALPFIGLTWQPVP
jgi:Tol biopolymer transport system component